MEMPKSLHPCRIHLHQPTEFTCNDQHKRCHVQRAGPGFCSTAAAWSPLFHGGRSFARAVLLFSFVSLGLASSRELDWFFGFATSLAMMESTQQKTPSMTWSAHSHCSLVDKLNQRFQFSGKGQRHALNQEISSLTRGNQQSWKTSKVTVRICKIHPLVQETGFSSLRTVRRPVTVCGRS